MIDDTGPGRTIPRPNRYDMDTGHDLPTQAGDNNAVLFMICAVFAIAIVMLCIFGAVLAHEQGKTERAKIEAGIYEK